MSASEIAQVGPRFLARIIDGFNGFPAGYIEESYSVGENGSLHELIRDREVAHAL